jgi:uncharacterized protein YlxW (UPF0749 family)
LVKEKEEELKNEREKWERKIKEMQEKMKREKEEIEREFKK